MTASRTRRLHSSNCRGRGLRSLWTISAPATLPCLILRDYPVDVIKIDRSFVGKVTYDAEVRAIVCAVLELAKSLKLDVVAEGVEAEGQRRLLIEQGCRLGQGYFFGQAVETDEFPHLLIQPAGRRAVAT